MPRLGVRVYHNLIGWFSCIACCNYNEVLSGMYVWSVACCYYIYGRQFYDKLGHGQERPVRCS
jgi:hypothetical protein